MPQRRRVPPQPNSAPVAMADRTSPSSGQSSVRDDSARETTLPRDVRPLVLDLLDSRPLSMSNLDRLIKFLRDHQTELVQNEAERKTENPAESGLSSLGSSASQWPSVGHPDGYSRSNATNYLSTTAANFSTLPSTSSTAPPSNANNSNYGSASSYPVVNQPYASLSNPDLKSAFALPPIPQSKQSQLEERILNLMKNQAGLPPVDQSSAPPQRLAEPLPLGWRNSQVKTTIRDKLRGQDDGNEQYCPWGV